MAKWTLSSSRDDPTGYCLIQRAMPAGIARPPSLRSVRPASPRPLPLPTPPPLESPPAGGHPPRGGARGAASASVPLGSCILARAAETRGKVIEIKLTDAEGHLEELIAEAAAGEEVVITSASGSAVRLVAIPRKVRAESAPSATVIGRALDRFMGTWPPEQAAEMLHSIEVFEQVDESFWT